MARASSTTSASSPPIQPVVLSTSPAGSVGARRRSYIEAGNTGDPNSDAVKSAAEEAATTPVEEARNQAPGILDRRRSQRPNITVRKSIGTGDSVRRAKSVRGLGPNLPVRVPPSPGPLKSPTMSDVRSRMRSQDDDVDSSVRAIVMFDDNQIDNQLIALLHRMLSRTRRSRFLHEFPPEHRPGIQTWRRAKSSKLWGLESMMV